jgi:hypothetical protein
MHYNRWLFRVCLCVVCVIEIVVRKHCEKIRFKLVHTGRHVVFRAKEMQCETSYNALRCESSCSKSNRIDKLTAVKL